jgi:hypothetical protein
VSRQLIWAEKGFSYRVLLPFVITVSPVVIGTGAEILAAEILGAAAFAAGATVPAGGRVAPRVTQGVPPSLVSQPTRHSLNKEIGTIYEIRSSCKKKVVIDLKKYGSAGTELKSSTHHQR